MGEKIAPDRRCKYCGRMFTPKWVARNTQLFCGKDCKYFSDQLDRYGTRHCWRCGMKLMDRTKSKICKTFRQELKRVRKLPKLNDMSPEELLYYGRTQTHYLVEEGGT